jgi:hypothetical protein
MQAIAYTIDGAPRLTWPAVTETEVLDNDGNPTGETVTTDNLQTLVADLPPGTDYTLVTEHEAAAWWAANQSPEALAEHRRAAIQARLVAIDAASVRPLRAIAQDEAVQADHDRLAALDAEAAELRLELAGMGLEEASAELPPELRPE